MTAGAVVTTMYEDVELLLHDLCHKFVRRYAGNDYDEVRSQANLEFMYAHSKYNPSKGKYSSWIRFRVWICLFEKYVRQNARKWARNPKQEFVEPETFVAEEPQTKIERILPDLSDDAKTVVSMVFDIPNDVKLCLHPKKTRRTPDNYRSAFKEVLKDMGWKQYRIYMAFEEITEALS